MRVGWADSKRRERKIENEEKKEKQELTPSASVRIVNCRVDVSQVDFAHEAIDLCWKEIT